MSTSMRAAKSPKPTMDHLRNSTTRPPKLVTCGDLIVLCICLKATCLTEVEPQVKTMSKSVGPSSRPSVAVTGRAGSAPQRKKKPAACHRWHANTDVRRI
eukprot:6452471-Amphidinium_carterae.2